MTANDLFPLLVQIDSPTSHEKALSEYVMHFLEHECSLNPQLDPHQNVIVTVPGVGEPVFFCAHLDTVEPGRGVIPVLEQGIWRSSGETILGADNKAAVSALLASIWEICQETASTTRPLEVVFTTFEETNNAGALGIDRTTFEATRGYIFDACAPIGTIVTQAPFYARFDITIEGRAAHASKRNEAIPAMTIAIPLIQAIESLRTDDLLINIGMISGGSARNTVMGTLTLHGEIRSFQHTLFRQAIKTLQKYCDTTDHCTGTIAIENQGYIHSKKVINDAIALMHASGITPKPRESFACSDANIFNTGESPLVVVVLGDGVVGAHTTQEQVKSEDLERMQSIIRTAVNGSFTSTP